MRLSHSVLLFFSLLLPLAAWGQSQSTIVYTYDEGGNRTGRDSIPVSTLLQRQTRDSALQKITHFPSAQSLDVKQNQSVSLVSLDTSRRSLVLSPEQKAAAYEKWVKESDAIRTVALRSVRSTPDTTTYAFGEITLQEGMTPSGGRTYSIPIPTAAGYRFVPSVAIGYNSQADEGWAGYGWDIQGLSSITLINKNKYYHGEAKGANVIANDPVFALDGVPLVTNTQSQSASSYPLITARGNILAVPLDEGPAGCIWGFDVLYPNGVRARYGSNLDYGTLCLSYPITEMTDLEGNRIVFSYTDPEEDGDFRLDAIRYGFDAGNQYQAEISFTYVYSSGSPVRYFAGAKRVRDYRLTEVLSKNGTETIARYGLTYEQADNVFLLNQVSCTNDSTLLRPIRFEYKDFEYQPDPPTSRLFKQDFYFLPSNFSSSADCIYRRGKFVKDNYNDGIIIHPHFPEYDYLSAHYNIFDGYSFLFGSSYPSDQVILFFPTLDIYSQYDNSITTGSGFQTIEAVDVDGDGLDELVKVNFNGASGGNTKLLITVYKCNASGIPVQNDQFEVQIQGTVVSGIYESPSYRTYRWGDFLGNGKVQLLAIAYNQNNSSSGITYSQTSYAALIDVASHTKRYDAALFDYPIDNAGSLLVVDLDNDGQTELCYATSAGLTAYRFLQGQGFVTDSFYSNITDNVFSSSNQPYYVTDLNGDGYVDILRAPSTGYDSTWHRYAYTGNSFMHSFINLTYRLEDEDEFMFIDLNRDGLADLVKVSEDGLGSCMNINGNSYGSYQCLIPTLTNTKGIIPANVVDRWNMSAFIKVDGFFVDKYEYEPLSPKMRQLTTVIDSRQRLFVNHYEYLPSHSYSHWSDNSFTVNNANGYVFQTLPLYVLEEEKAYQNAQSVSGLFKDRRYSYFNGVAHNGGLGFCGFSKIRTDDYLNEGLRDFTDQVFNPEKMGVVTTVEKRKGSYNGAPYSSVVNTYDSHTTTYGKLNPRLTQSVAVDTLTHINTTTTYTYDSYDFPTSINVSRRIGTGPAKTENTTRIYQHNPITSKYVLGTMTQEDVLKESDGHSNSTWREVTQITYDSDFHPLTQSVFVGPMPNSRAPGGEINLPPLGTNLVSRTQWQYDIHGNVISETSAPYNATQYTGNTYTYDSAGRYLLTETDALGHTTTYAGHNKFGKPSSATDYHGNTTYYYYDDWGNLVRTVSPDSTVTQTTTAWGGNGLYTVTSTATGKPERATHYDAMGREIRSGIKRFDGQWQWVDREYNNAGKIKRTSLPYRGNTPSYWNTYHYDVYNRPDTLLEASGKQTTWSYSGTSVTTIQDGVASTKTTDANGNLVSATDAGGTITYTLRDDGQPHTITAPGNVQTTITYDKYGNRWEINDPSAGVQTDTCIWMANGTSERIHIDANGRYKTKVDQYGRVTAICIPWKMSYKNSEVFSYDADGRLSGKQVLQSSIQTTYTYDNLDRISETVESVPDGKWLKKRYVYGPGSNIASIQYISQTDTITTENHTYTNGYLTGVTLTDGTIVWSLTSENDQGNPTAITSGTISRTYGYTAFGLPTSRAMDGGDLQDFNYSFDTTTGNLLQRSDGIHNQSETFGYDALNRLTSIGTRQITYGTNGDILSIDGVGDLTYGDSSHPYQITHLTPEVGGIAPERRQIIFYDRYVHPSIITEGGRSASFTYNVDHDRVRMQVTDSTGTLLSRYYIGGQYELDIAGSTTKERLYLGGDAYSAPMVYVRTGGSGGWTAYNIGRDYLGSITHIATTDGTLVAEYSYDPWGRLRNPATLAIYTLGNEPDLFLGRGFTGHEHLPWFGLINMNARLYDPLLGRFLNPDPYVQAPDFTQSLNRYSYALNNPMKYTDPSGEFFIIDSFLVGLFTGGWDRACQMAENDLKIWGGLFNVDKNKGGLGGFVELLSRFTWQLPQTVIGFLFTQTVNTFHLAGGVESVDYLHGATVLRSNDSNWGAITFGSFITGDSSIRADDENRLFQHEFGHYLQSQEHGLLWLLTYAIESGISASVNKPREHDHVYTEQDANARSFKYLVEEYGEDYAVKVWDFDFNPIDGYDRSKSYNDNISVLRGSILSLFLPISTIPVENNNSHILFPETSETAVCIL